MAIHGLQMGGKKPLTIPTIVLQVPAFPRKSLGLPAGSDPSTLRGEFSRRTQNSAGSFSRQKPAGFLSLEKNAEVSPKKNLHLWKTWRFGWLVKWRPLPFPSFKEKRCENKEFLFWIYHPGRSNLPLCSNLMNFQLHELSMNNSTSHQFKKSSWRSGLAKWRHTNTKTYSKLRIKHIQSNKITFSPNKIMIHWKIVVVFERQRPCWKIRPKAFNAPMILEVEHFHLPGLKLISSNTNWMILGGGGRSHQYLSNSTEKDLLIYWKSLC